MHVPLSEDQKQALLRPVTPLVRARATPRARDEDFEPDLPGECTHAAFDVAVETETSRTPSQMLLDVLQGPGLPALGRTLAEPYRLGAADVPVAVVVQSATKSARTCPLNHVTIKEIFWAVGGPATADLVTVLRPLRDATDRPQLGELRCPDDSPLIPLVKQFVWSSSFAVRVLVQIP